MLRPCVLYACGAPKRRGDPPGRPPTPPAPTGGGGAPTPPAGPPGEATSTTGIHPVVFEPPAAGQRMLWIDASPVVYVPGGAFIMGQDEDEPSDHSPAHAVTLDPFWVAQAEAAAPR